MTDEHPPKAYDLDAFAHLPEAPDDGSPRPERPDLDAPVVADDGFRVTVSFTAPIPERFPGHDDGQRIAQLRRAIDSAIDQYLLGSGDLEAATITLGEDTISDQSFSDREPTDIRGQQWVRVEGPHTREALRAEERAASAARRRAEQTEPHIDVTTSGGVQTERTIHPDGSVTYRMRYRDPGPGDGWGDWVDARRVVRSPADAHLEPAPTTRTEQVIVAPDLPYPTASEAAAGRPDAEQALYPTQSEIAQAERARVREAIDRHFEEDITEQSADALTDDIMAALGEGD